jgi:hypothetical protein
LFLRPYPPPPLSHGSPCPPTPASSASHPLPPHATRNGSLPWDDGWHCAWSFSCLPGTSARQPSVGEPPRRIEQYGAMIGEPASLR